MASANSRSFTTGVSESPEDCTGSAWELHEDIWELHSHFPSQHKAAYQIILLKIIFPCAETVCNGSLCRLLMLWYAVCIPLACLHLSYLWNHTFSSFSSFSVSDFWVKPFSLQACACTWTDTDNVSPSYMCLKLQNDYFPWRGFSLSFLAGWWERWRGSHSLILSSVMLFIRIKSWWDRNIWKFQSHKAHVAFTDNLLWYFSTLRPNQCWVN